MPIDELTKKDGSIGKLAERQRIQITSTLKKDIWLGPALADRIAALERSLHFVDFEASRLALPYHAGMRPYGDVVFQRSCHTVDAPGAEPRHSEWLNLENVWPNREFALALRRAIGDSTPVLTWSAFEGSTLDEISRDLAEFGHTDPELPDWIANVRARRIVDLHAWTLSDFFHPGMRGRTSIKVVLDALWKSDQAIEGAMLASPNIPSCVNSVAHDNRPGRILPDAQSSGSLPGIGSAIHDEATPR